MRIHKTKTGEAIFQKRLQRYDDFGHARELTFSCYARYQFLSRDRTCEGFIEALSAARRKWPFDVWAYVIMPENIHLLIYPRERGMKIGPIVGEIKESVARKAIRYLSVHAPEWLERISVMEGERLRHRFWQPGGGFDRNAVELRTVHYMIDYIHANPVRRRLAVNALDWRWSSAQWYAGVCGTPIELDRTIPVLNVGLS